MGHAHHFLSRLDRVGAADVELALSLYNNHKALRFVLEQAALPDGAERVAVALSDDPAPPWVLVTRDGKFVTCLAAGMRHDLPVVPRAKLDRLRDEHGELAAHLRAARAMNHDEGAVTGLLGKLRKGPDVSREDVASLAALAPLLLSELVKWQVEDAAKLERLRDQLVPLLRKTKKPRGSALAKLELHYQLSWSVAHLAALTSIALKPALVHVPPTDAGRAAYDLARAPAETGSLPHLARALFAAARLGPIALPTYEEAFASCTSRIDHIHGTLAVAAIALRHPEARAEVDRLIALPAAGDTPFLRGMQKLRAGLPDLCFGERAAYRRLAGVAGAEALIALATARLPVGHPHRFEHPRDVPYSLALPMALRWATDAIAEPNGVATLACHVPWLVDARVEDLYLPADALAWVRTPFTPEAGAKVLETALLEEQAWIDAHARPEGPSRNGPCPCGSGKKHKRCCGG